MSAYNTRWRTVLSCLCLLGLVPLTASSEPLAKRWQQEKHREAQQSKQQETESSREQRGKDKQPQRRDQSEQRQAPRKERKWHQPIPRRPVQAQPERRDRSDKQKPRKERDRQQPQTPRRPVQVPTERHERTERKQEPRDDRDRKDRRQETRDDRDRKDRRQETRDDRDRNKSLPRERRYTYPERRDRERRVWKPNKRTKPLKSHDRHYKRKPIKERHPPYYHHRHENYYYHTYFLSPIHRHYIPRGYRLRHLPRGFIRIVIGSLPYFYYSGVYYRDHLDGYIVVGAPIGALVYELPIGFITFGIGNFVYYFVNDTYYFWDDVREAYVVVEKPDGADEAIAAATEERLYVYPNLGQSQEQQSRDRYECHRWAVQESGVDPSLWDEYEITYEDRSNYRRAISACLEGRGYTVK